MKQPRPMYKASFIEPNSTSKDSFSILSSQHDTSDHINLSVLPRVTRFSQYSTESKQLRMNNIVGPHQPNNLLGWMGSSSVAVSKSSITNRVVALKRSMCTLYEGTPKQRLPLYNGPFSVNTVIIDLFTMYDDSKKFTIDEIVTQI